MECQASLNYCGCSIPSNLPKSLKPNRLCLQHESLTTATQPVLQLILFHSWVKSKYELYNNIFKQLFVNLFAYYHFE